MERVSELEKAGNAKATLKECLRLAKGGSYDAQMTVAWKYQCAKGTSVDTEAAEHWYRRASETEVLIDRLTAQFYLASLFGKTERYEEAFELMEGVANQGYLPAAFRLGEMLSNGIGCDKDDELAVYYREYAANRGHVWAQRNVAARMIRGQYGLIKVPLGFCRFVWTLERIRFSPGHILRQRSSFYIRWG